MATSGTGAIITRGQLVNKFGAAYWKNKTLPTTTSDNQCVTAEWINNNINSPNYRWTQANTYSGAGKKLVKAVHCYNGSTNYLEPVITYSYSIAFSSAPTNINVGSTGKFTVTLTTKTYTGGELSNTATADVSSDCTWTSSSTTNATVSSNGTVTGVLGLYDGTSNGKAVTVTAVHPTYGTLTANVNIKDVISSRAYSVDITTSNFELKYGDTTSQQLAWKTYDIKTVNNADYGSAYEVTNKTVTFSSNKTGNATVNSSGKVTWVAGAANGTENGVSVTITATYSGKTDTVTCTTKDKTAKGGVKSRRLAVTATASTIYVGSTSTFTGTGYTTYKLNINGTDSNSYNWGEDNDGPQTCTWTSGSTSVATISGATATGKAGKGDGTETAVSTTITGSNSTYGSGTYTLYVKDKITYDLVLDKSTASIYWYAGTKTVSLTATYRTKINNAVASSLNKNVTSSATWTSSATAKATVSAGTVTGKATGSSTITATYNGYTASCTVSVNDYVTTSYSLSINTTSKIVTNFPSGTSFTITPTVTKTVTINGNAASSTVTGTYTWTSSNETIATVSDGTVTVKGAKYGSVTITCKETAYTGASKTCAVTVNYSYYVYDFSISPTSKTIDAGNSFTITPTLKRATVSNGVTGSYSAITGTYTWTSSNTAVATVSNGTVTGVSGKYGTSTITCKETAYTGASKTCSATVNYSYTEYWISPNPIVVSVTTASAPTYTPVSAYMRTNTNGVTGTSINRSNNSTWSCVGAAAIFNPVTGAMVIRNTTPVGTGVVVATDSVYGYSASALYSAVWAGSTGGSTGGTTTTTYPGVIGATVVSTGPNVPGTISAWGYSYEYTPGNLGTTQVVPIYAVQNIINGYSFKPTYLSTPTVIGTSGMYISQWGPPSQSRTWSSALSTPGYLWIFMGSGSAVNNSYGQLLCLNISSSVINSADASRSSTAVTMANCTKYIVV